MKRIALFTLLLCFLIPCAQASTSDATVVAPDTLKITAPYAGTLLPFDWKSGDPVAEADTLFTYQLTPIYAPVSGRVAAVNAAPGDEASGVQSRYGALAIIEPIYPLYLDANTSQAYDKDANKYIHVGEHIYLKDGNEKGIGRITSVNGDSYIVEVLSGAYDPGDTVRCFRESSYPYDSEIGRGKVKRYADTTVSGQGRILALHCYEGMDVKTGDLLFEAADSMAVPGTSVNIQAAGSGVISAIYVTGGQQVYRGQLLCEITLLDKLELSLELDELDLPSIREGDVLDYTLDAYPNRTFSGTVTRIYPLGTQKQNATYYDVRLRISPDVPLYPGMNGTVTVKN